MTAREWKLDASDLTLFEMGGLKMDGSEKIHPSHLTLWHSAFLALLRVRVLFWAEFKGWISTRFLHLLVTSFCLFDGGEGRSSYQF